MNKALTTAAALFVAAAAGSAQAAILANGNYYTTTQIEVISAPAAGVAETCTAKGFVAGTLVRGVTPVKATAGKLTQFATAGGAVFPITCKLPAFPTALSVVDPVTGTNTWNGATTCVLSAVPTVTAYKLNGVKGVNNHNVVAADGQSAVATSFAGVQILGNTALDCKATLTTVFTRIGS